MSREEYPTFISTHLTGTRPLSVTKQRGQTLETTATTTTDESLHFRQLVATTNPFYSTTESSGDHMSTPKTTVMTGHIPMVSQGHVSILEGSLLRDTYGYQHNRLNFHFSVWTTSNQ